MLLAFASFYCTNVGDRKRRATNTTSLCCDTISVGDELDFFESVHQPNLPHSFVYWLLLLSDDASDISDLEAINASILVLKRHRSVTSRTSEYANFNELEGVKAEQPDRGPDSTIKLF